jgi:hypothetical protein
MAPAAQHWTCIARAILQSRVQFERENAIERVYFSRRLCVRVAFAARQLLGVLKARKKLARRRAGSHTPSELAARAPRGMPVPAGANLNVHVERANPACTL